MAVKAEISVEQLNWRQWSSFAPTWERIHSRSPEASFFLSREWVDCWLATFGGEFSPDLLAFVRDGEVVGCCLLVRRTQSGFRYGSDGRLKPGLVSHYPGIRHCVAQSALNEYDFLAGDSQYKRPLATTSRPMAWIVVRRSTPATLLFRGRSFMGQKYVQLLKKNR
jgi:CelD/BcsL family acetyltransferase involved in cellulose biosynthesis